MCEESTRHTDGTLMLIVLPWGFYIMAVVISTVTPFIPPRLNFNSLWPSDAIWWHKFGSTLAQVMNMNQCSLIISKVWWHSSESIKTLKSTLKSNLTRSIELNFEVPWIFNILHTITKPNQFPLPTPWLERRASIMQKQSTLWWLLSLIALLIKGMLIRSN